METGNYITVSLWAEKAFYGRIVILHVAERTLMPEAKKLAIGYFEI